MVDARQQGDLLMDARSSILDSHHIGVRMSDDCIEGKTVEPSHGSLVRLEALAKLDRQLAWVVILLPLVGSLVALILLFFGYGIGWVEVGILLGMYIVTMLGVEVGYHRYFTHNSFRTNRVVQVVLAISGAMAFQGPVIWWAATHRRHHHYSDQLGDPHSPNLHGGGRLEQLQGLLHSHMGWIFVPESTRPAGWARYARDLYQDRLIFRIHMSYFYWLVLGLALPGVLGGVLTGTWKGVFLGFLWGGLIRIFLQNHFVWALNSICHTYGSRPFNTPRDLSRNNAWLAIPTLGQGWHNNHHAFPNSSMTSFAWWQVDIAGWVIRLLQLLGLAWDVKVPTAAIIAARREVLNNRNERLRKSP
jgi:stearoyl-CoA desaturase (delta-9 desaturase)